MSPRLAPYSQLSTRFPRVSGDEPRNIVRLWGRVEFSPRERG